MAYIFQRIEINFSNCNPSVNFYRRSFESSLSPYSKPIKMKRRKIFKVLLISSGVLVLLFAVLIAHIYAVTKDRYSSTQIQISRIDFTNKPDSALASEVISYMHSIKGVNHVYFNIPAGTMVYGYNSGALDSRRVYADLIKHGNYEAKPFIVSATDATKGCPVFDKNSTGARFSKFIYKLFN